MINNIAKIQINSKFSKSAYVFDHSAAHSRSRITSFAFLAYLQQLTKYNGLPGLQCIAKGISHFHQLTQSDEYANSESTY